MLGCGPGLLLLPLDRAVFLPSDSLRVRNEPLTGAAVTLLFASAVCRTVSLQCEALLPDLLSFVIPPALVGWPDTCHLCHFPA